MHAAILIALPAACPSVAEFGGFCPALATAPGDPTATCRGLAARPARMRVRLH